MERITLFADVLLPLPVGGTFTYRVPFDLNDQVMAGVRVVVQFGARKIYTALVARVHETPPDDRLPKYIYSVLDENPIVTPVQTAFWGWIAEYYLCHPGEGMARGHGDLFDVLAYLLGALRQFCRCRCGLVYG